MQAKEAARLQRLTGNADCTHPEITKEFAKGIATGDYVCTTCGEARWGAHWLEERQQAAKKVEGFSA